MTQDERATELLERIKYNIAGCCINDLAASNASKKVASLVVDEILFALRELFGFDETDQPDIAYYMKVREKLNNETH